MTTPGQVSSAAVHPRPTRVHLVLVTYGCFLACTQLVWLTYAPVTAHAATDFGVSEGAVGDLAVLVLAACVALGILSGRWLDRRFRSTLALGIGLTVVGGIVRAADAESFRVALAGQSLVALGQPLVVNAMTKLPALLLPQRGTTRAIAALSAALFVGMLAAVGLGGTLYQAGGLHLLVGVHAAATAVFGAAALAMVLLLPPQIVEPPSAAGSVLRSRMLWLLAGAAFVGFGLFNAMVTWLDPILTGLGRPGAAGWSGTVMIIAGIAGAAVVPNIAARSDRRRAALLAVACIGALVPLAMAVAPGTVVETLLLATSGCAALAGLPLILDFSERVAGAANAATAAGFVTLVGNLGGTAYVLVVQLLLGDAQTALIVLGLLGLPAVWIAGRLPRSVRDIAAHPLSEVDGCALGDRAPVQPPRPALEG